MEGIKPCGVVQVHPSFKSFAWVMIQIRTQMEEQKDWLTRHLEECLKEQDHALQRGLVLWLRKYESQILECWIKQSPQKWNVNLTFEDQVYWVDRLPEASHPIYVQIFESLYIQWKRGELSAELHQAFRDLDECVQHDGNCRVRLVQEHQEVCRRMQEDFTLQMTEPYMPSHFASASEPSFIAGVKARTRAGRLHLWHAVQKETILKMWLEQTRSVPTEELLEQGASHRDEVVHVLNYYQHNVLKSVLERESQLAQVAGT
jgi:hypothetical protein